MAGRELSDEARRRLSEAQRRRFAASGGHAETTKRKIAESNRRRGRKWHDELAEALRDVGHLDDRQAGALLGKDKATIRVVRDERGLPGPRRHPRNGATP